MPKKYGKPDRENPEWTADELRQSVPAGDVFPDVFPAKRGRGKQKAPTKQLVSLRIDKHTLEMYRATGRGWQARIASDLARAAKRRIRPLQARSAVGVGGLR